MLSKDAPKPSSDIAFEFTTPIRDEVGHKNEGGSDRDPGDHHCGDSGESYACDGRIQLQVQGSMEVHLPVNRRKCENRSPTTNRSIVGADGESLVENPVEWTNFRRGKEDSAVDFSPNLLDPNLMQGEPSIIAIREKNAQASTYFNFINGESALHQAHSYFQANIGVQSALDSARTRDWGLGTLHDVCSGEGNVNGNDEENQMEFEEGGRAFTSV